LGHDVAGGHQEALDPTGRRRPELGRGLLDLDLADEVALAHHRARLDEPGHQDPFIDRLREAWHLDLAAHAP
jgi:hypothetical protein